jgi:hypothetical protein
MLNSYSSRRPLLEAMKREQRKNAQNKNADIMNPTLSNGNDNPMGNLGAM